MAFLRDMIIVTIDRWVFEMSFSPNQSQQLSVDDKVNFLSDREKRFLKNSWAKDFAENIFPAINEERFAVLYSSNGFSCPNTQVNVVISALLMKEMCALTDGELLSSILFDTRFQYALHTPRASTNSLSVTGRSAVFAKSFIGMSSKRGLTSLRKRCRPVKAFRQVLEDQPILETNVQCDSGFQLQKDVAVGNRLYLHQQAHPVGPVRRIEKTAHAETFRIPSG